MGGKLVNDSFSSHCSILSSQQEAVHMSGCCGRETGPSVDGLQYWE